MENARLLFLALLCLMPVLLGAAGGHNDELAEGAIALPIPLEDYKAEETSLGIDSLAEILLHRIGQNPFNLVASASPRWPRNMPWWPARLPAASRLS